MKALQNGKPGERIIAAETLGDLGPKAEGAIPALVELIRNTPAPVPNEREWSREETATNFLLKATWDALARIGPKAVPALIDLLAHQDAEIRGRAAAAIKTIGPGAADAVPALIKRLGEGENQWVCFNALEALAAIGSKAEAAVPALIKTVLDPKATIPEEKIWASDDMGPYWSRPLPLRVAAAQALAAIGPKALPAVKKDLFPAIIQALDDDQRRPRPDFGWVDDSDVWEPFGADAAPLVPAIVRCLSRDQAKWLVLSLLQLGPDGQKAFADRLSDKDERVRNERFIELCKQGFFRSGRADCRPIVPQLIAFLTGKDYYIRFVALVNINRGSGVVPPELTKAALPLLDDIEFLKYVHKLSEEHGYEPEFVKLCGPAAMPTLLKYFKSDDKELRKFAVRELRGIRGPGTEALLPTLRELATGKTKHPEITHWTALRSAIGISLDSKDVELLVPFLKSSDPKERVAAAFEFRGLRHLARPHLKHLFPLLKDQDADVRRFAASAIHALAPSDPDGCARSTSGSSIPVTVSGLSTPARLRRKSHRPFPRCSRCSNAERSTPRGTAATWFGRSVRRRRTRFHSSCRTSPAYPTPRCLTTRTNSTQRLSLARSVRLGQPRRTPYL